MLDDTAEKTIGNRDHASIVRDKSRLLMEKDLNVAEIYSPLLGQLGLFFQPFLTSVSFLCFLTKNLVLATFYSARTTPFEGALCGFNSHKFNGHFMFNIMHSGYRPYDNCILRQLFQTVATIQQLQISKGEAYYG